MNIKILHHIFSLGTDLLHDDDEDSICIGSMLPCYSPSGVEQIMLYNTAVIDSLLELPKLSALQTVELLSMRGFTFHEYRTVLFDLTIHEKDFGKYPALRCFFFSSDKERKEKVIYHYNRDSHNDYLSLLEKMLQNTNPSIFSYLFTDEG